MHPNSLSNVKLLFIKRLHSIIAFCKLPKLRIPLIELLLKSFSRTVMFFIVELYGVMNAPFNKLAFIELLRKQLLVTVIVGLPGEPVVKEIPPPLDTIESLVIER